MKAIALIILIGRFIIPAYTQPFQIDSGMHVSEGFKSVVCYTGSIPTDTLLCREYQCVNDTNTGYYVSYIYNDIYYMFRYMHDSVISQIQCKANGRIIEFQISTQHSIGERIVMDNRGHIWKRNVFTNTGVNIEEIKFYRSGRTYIHRIYGSDGKLLQVRYYKRNGKIKRVIYG